MGAKYSLMIDKMMNEMRFNKLRACLCQVALGVALSGALYSCRMDSPNASEQGKEGKSITLNMDLGEIELDPETMINYAKVTQERGIEMTTPDQDTDAAGKAKHPTFAFADTGQDEEDFPVFIALFGERQKVDCYGRATWKLVREVKDGKTRYSVRTKTPITFEEGHAPDLTKLKSGERWRLFAIHAPGGTWDADTKSYKWSANKVVKKLYGAGEKLLIGTDIDIPFVLGRRMPSGTTDTWWEGFPVKAVKSKDWNFEGEELYLDPPTNKKPLRARFKMLGSLMAIRLQNNMKINEPKDELIIDPDEKVLKELKYRPTYDFSIKGFYVESTQAVTSVAYNFEKTYMDITPVQREVIKISDKRIADDAVRWIVGRPGVRVEELPQKVPTNENPTRIYIPFDKDNYAALDRQTTSKTLYVWMSEVDATGKRPTASEGYGTAVWADLENKTINLPMGHTFVYTAKSAHSTGYAYRSIVPLVEELRINPLARMGFGYLSGNPMDKTTTCTFARATAINAFRPERPGDPGCGKPYPYFKGDVKLVDFENERFKVDYLEDESPAGDGSFLTLRHGNLYWEVPDRYDIFSVFPYQGTDLDLHKSLPGILYDVDGDRMSSVQIEKARIDGRRYDNLKSIYYREKKVKASDQQEDSSISEVYAFRFIGTSMAVGVRYTEIGKWYNGSGETVGVINPRSRYRIEMKTIGNAYGFKSLTDEQAKQYLKNVISKKSFWETESGMRLPEVVVREIHVNGYWTTTQTGNYGGQSFYIWTRNRHDQSTTNTGKTTYPGVYQNLRSDNGGLLWRVATKAEVGGIGGHFHKGFYVLPWLSLDQSPKN